MLFIFIYRGTCDSLVLFLILVSPHSSLSSTSAQALVAYPDQSCCLDFLPFDTVTLVLSCVFTVTMSDQPAASPTAEPVSVSAPAATPAAEKAPESQPEQKTEPAESTATEQKTEQPASNDTPATENKDTTTETPAVEESKPTETPANDNNKENDGKEAQPEKPVYLKNNAALSQFFDRLSEILKNAEYSEMWGVTLQEDSAHIPTINILIKYLRANEGNVKLAEGQLVKALKWRKTMDPVALAESGVYDAGKFAGLGYLTNYTGADGKETVVTWNIYGAVKDLGHAFGDLDE